jgi:nicotinamidase-related amidase
MVGELKTTRRKALAALSCGALAWRARGGQTGGGVLRLRSRSRAEEPAGSGTTQVREEDLFWKPPETAIIICDMWDNHYCQNAARRVMAMAPRMNQVIKSARSHGVTIIHAPSGTMDEYAGMPQRRRLMEAPKAAPPVPILRSCPLDRTKEAELPIDDITEPCDDEVVGQAVRRFNRQNGLLEIAPEDGISDDGLEIYSYFRQQRISHVVLMGVHTNMCVLGRPFGIRQQVRLGMNVVLARDLTDAMYDPRQRPRVSHERGTELVVQHIERYWCPSIPSEDLTRLAGGRAASSGS